MTDNTTFDRMSRSLAGTTSRRQALKLLGGGLVGSVAVASGIKIATAQTTNPSLSAIPITGTFTDALGGTGTFEGLFDITRFAVRAGELVAVGTLTGTLTDSLDNIIGTITQTIRLPVDIGDAACEILELTLGPLDLDLLGLNVFLDEVFLEITAEPGPGNLLGNLLCAIAGLLDQGADLNAIARLLNRLLGILG